MQAKRQWADASSDAGSRAKELDFLQFEVQEIEAAHLIPGEDEELEASYRMMANGQKISGSALRGRESDRGERLFRGRR